MTDWTPWVIMYAIMLVQIVVLVVVELELHRDLSGHALYRQAPAGDNPPDAPEDVREAHSGSYEPSGWHPLLHPTYCGRGKLCTCARIDNCAMEKAQNRAPKP